MCIRDSAKCELLMQAQRNGIGKLLGRPAKLRGNRGKCVHGLVSGNTDAVRVVELVGARDHDAVAGFQARGDFDTGETGRAGADGAATVSYTHLDVYKRQGAHWWAARSARPCVANRNNCSSNCDRH